MSSETYPRIPETDVEIVEPPPRGQIRHALLDFDGTVSYLRDGWQDLKEIPIIRDIISLQSISGVRPFLEPVTVVSRLPI